MNQAHKIYEEHRLVGTTKKRKDELDAMLVELYKSVPDPKNYQEISKLNTFKEYLKELGIDLI